MRILLLTLLLLAALGHAAPVMAEEPKPRPKATAADRPAGPLTPEERRFMGVWRDGYTLVFDGRDFCADTQPGEWYEGFIRIRTDVEPAQLDFVILVQSGQPNGNTSEAIFRWDGDTIEVLAPSPGSPRPPAFAEKTEGLVRLELRKDGKSKFPASHCLGESR
ncbi:hypothetical protein ABI59_16975 [Acidobacteria bacterium Mor1]|nr:hypothetical protein ABI59_16975 [Acidobacteria bacterium Mor1]